MSQDHANEPVLAEVVEPILQTHWEAIQNKRQELVEVLEQMEVSFPKEGKRRLRSLGAWFSQRRSFEEALLRADVLGVCLPLSKSWSNSSGNPEPSLRRSDIASAARIGFCSIGQNTVSSSQLLKALVYPAIVLIGAVLVALVLSVVVVPEFEKMFEEFGIELPAVTIFFLETAQLLRAWGWIFVVWWLSVMAIVWFLNGVSSRRRPDCQGWLELCLKSSRTALADWVWHISLLLEVGLPQAAAMAVASRFPGKSWLRAKSDFWVGGDQSNLAQNAVGQSRLLSGQYLKSPKYRLLDHALAVPASEGKIHLLREVAMYYRDRNRNIGLWWIEWLVAIFLWAMGLIILLFVFAFFAPLLAIVSGFTAN